MRKLTASNTVMWNVALNPTETAHSLHRCSMKRAEECVAPSSRRSPNAYQNFNLKLSRLFKFFLPLMYLDLFSSNRLDAEPPMMLLTGDDPQVVICTQVLTPSHQFAGLLSSSSSSQCVIQWRSATWASPNSACGLPNHPPWLVESQL